MKKLAEVNVRLCCLLILALAAVVLMVFLFHSSNEPALPRANDNDVGGPASLATTSQTTGSLSSTASATLPRGSDRATQARMIESYGNLPMSFEANEGQTDPQAKFLSRGTGYSLFLTSTEAVLALTRSAPSGGKDSPDSQIDQVSRTHVRRTASEVKQISSPEDVVRIRMIDANPAAQTTGLNGLPGKSNYFIGNDPKEWRTDVAHYAGVQYKNVYAGVDLIYYGNQHQLEYDFVVAPGADPKIIRMAYKGSRSVDIDDEGNLVLHLSNGQFKQGPPLVYQIVNQTRKEVSGRYVISGTVEVSFDIGRYDTSKPLVIDPAFVFSTYFGGGDRDLGGSITTDSVGNSYVTGLTSSTSSGRSPWLGNYANPSLALPQILM
jgi:hypothetical protein